MEFGGSYRFDAKRAHVWAALNDVAVLKAAIPGCQRLAWTSDSTLEFELLVSLGPMHKRLAGDLALSNIVPAQHYTLSGRGRGGLLGLAHASADITLTDDGEATDLAFLAHGAANGAIMRLGRAVIGNSAQKIIDGFFERIGMAMGVQVRPLTA